MAAESPGPLTLPSLARPVNGDTPMTEVDTPPAEAPARPTDAGPAAGEAGPAGAFARQLAGVVP